MFRRLVSCACFSLRRLWSDIAEPGYNAYDVLNTELVLFLHILGHSRFGISQLHGLSPCILVQVGVEGVEVRNSF